jgi:hypothetical protein
LFGFFFLLLFVLLCFGVGVVLHWG